MDIHIWIVWTLLAKKRIDKSNITIFDQDSIQINLFQNPVILEFDTILW